LRPHSSHWRRDPQAALTDRTRLIKAAQNSEQKRLGSSAQTANDLIECLIKLAARPEMAFGSGVSFPSIGKALASGLIWTQNEINIGDKAFCFWNA